MTVWADILSGLLDQRLRTLLVVTESEVSYTVAPGLIILIWGVLLVLPWRFWSRIWAIARQTVLQALRMRVALALIFFLVSLVVVLPSWLQTDNTVDGRIRIVIAYTLYAAQFLLCVLTIFLATATLCSEIKQKQIYALDSKPVPRWCVLAGKWLGVMIIDMALCAAVGATLYAVVLYQARTPRMARVAITKDMPELLKMRIMGLRRSHAILESRLLRARESYTVAGPEGKPLGYYVAKWADEEYERLQKLGRLPKQRSKAWIITMLRARRARAFFPVGPGNVSLWRITGLPRRLPPNQIITFRFEFRGAPRPLENKLQGLWRFGRLNLDKKEFSGEGFYEVARDDKCEVTHDISIPAKCIDPKTGILSITYYNPVQPQKPTAVFPVNGVSVLVPVGGIGVNIARATMLIFTKLAYLAVLGVACASFLTFPVASFTAFTLYAVSLITAFLYKLISDISFFTGFVRPGSQIETGDALIKNVLAFVLVVFPDFSNYDPVPFLADGQAITWGMVAHATVWLIAIRGVIIAAIGGFIFHRRELAALDR